MPTTPSVTPFQQTLRYETDGQGLYEVTQEVARVVAESGMAQGLCTLFIQHTSASLTIQENADPSARHDLEHFFQRLVPENDPHFTHTAEGSDDIPAHIKSALTASSLNIPIANNRLVLGSWQGIYLWEHRNAPHRRSLFIHLSS